MSTEMAPIREYLEQLGVWKHAKADGKDMSVADQREAGMELVASVRDIVIGPMSMMKLMTHDIPLRGLVAEGHITEEELALVNHFNKVMDLTTSAIVHTISSKKIDMALKTLRRVEAQLRDNPTDKSREQLVTKRDACLGFLKGVWSMLYAKELAVARVGLIEVRVIAKARDELGTVLFERSTKANLGYSAAEIYVLSGRVTDMEMDVKFDPDAIEMDAGYWARFSNWLSPHEGHEKAKEDRKTIMEKVHGWADDHRKMDWTVRDGEGKIEYQATAKRIGMKLLSLPARALTWCHRTAVNIWDRLFGGSDSKKEKKVAEKAPAVQTANATA